MVCVVNRIMGDISVSRDSNASVDPIVELKTCFRRRARRSSRSSRRTRKQGHSEQALESRSEHDLPSS